MQRRRRRIEITTTLIRRDHFGRSPPHTNYIPTTPQSNSLLPLMYRYCTIPFRNSVALAQRMAVVLSASNAMGVVDLKHFIAACELHYTFKAINDVSTSIPIQVHLSLFRGTAPLCGDIFTSTDFTGMTPVTAGLPGRPTMHVATGWGESSGHVQDSENLPCSTCSACTMTSVGPMIIVPNRNTPVSNERVYKRRKVR